ncbi:hypothetical protein DIPPA_01311 [Diplonema papillatum]|nr:hypothetical protein DIPPA_01311 [Diplonema papillatum]
MEDEDVGMKAGRFTWRTVLEKDECEEEVLAAAETVDGSAGCWLAKMPFAAAKQLRAAPTGTTAALKIAKRRNGKRAIAIHLRTAAGGLLPAGFCQFCAAKPGSAAVKKPCCRQPALPWAAFGKPPFCEYCGTRLLPNASHCAACGTSELPVRTIPRLPSEQSRPAFVFHEVSRQSDVSLKRTYNFTFDPTPVTEKLDVFIPADCATVRQPAEEGTSSKRIKLEGDWRCAACGKSVPGACPVTGERHDIPQVATVGDLDQYAGVDDRLAGAFAFNKKTPQQLKTIVLRKLLEQDVGWPLGVLADACSESKQNIQRIIKDVAVQEGDGLWRPRKNLAL